ncbi:type II secretion system F family protein [Pelomonas sp. Root1237]|uniref:type II secretion system F family protein n=1 Tax=Pelomonas sp. Root1237 TaxID=1736434 RepID=UPI000701CE3F|nr:type II secretion system F family protein [Pelomonas sp. Root1237]KQV95044.1 hypothetical protein ASC91_25800 [Pelomonas sp. Root1237]
MIVRLAASATTATFSCDTRTSWPTEMKFRVRVLDPVLMSISETLVEAPSKEALGSQLADGRRIIAVVPLRDGLPSMTSARGSPGRALDVAWWCRELMTLLKAGMTVVEAIETLHVQSTGDVARASVQQGLLEQLHQGKPLSAAMESLNRFPMVLIASVRASERSSSLQEALANYLRYHDMLDALRKKVVSAAIYPALVLGLGLLVCTFLVMVVLPRFAAMYADVRGDMGWSTQVLVTASGFVHQHRPALLIALALTAAAAIMAWRRGAIQHVALRFVRAVPPVGRALREFRMAKFYHAVTVMFRGGYPLDEALRRCEGLALGDDVDAAMRAAHDALTQGARVSTAFADAGLTDTVTRRLLAVGERSGHFDQVLQTIAERHADNFALFMDRATRIVEPLMLLSVALLVGGIVVLMYLPIFDIASSIR